MWIGDTPIMHGESDRPVAGTADMHAAYYLSAPDMYCLCGGTTPPRPPDVSRLARPSNRLGGGGLVDLEIRPGDGDVG